MKPYRDKIETERYTLYLGDALSVLRALPDASVDSIVTDPPAGIAFMGKEWDNFGGRDHSGAAEAKAKYDAKAGRNMPYSNYRGVTQSEVKKARPKFIAFLTEIMAECLRVAKPGAYALVWAIPRTSHWTGTAIEDAGWVIQDRIAHLFGQGFPKHRSKLKPACEDWWLAWKPDRYATPLPGLDGCRIGYQSEEDMQSATPGGACTGKTGALAGGTQHNGERSKFERPELKGRWPANVTMDEEAAAMLDEASEPLMHGAGHAREEPGGGKYLGGDGWGNIGKNNKGFRLGDTGGASRFFYVAKTNKRDRNEGLEDLPSNDVSVGDQRPSGSMSQRIHKDEGRPDTIGKNTHPTVKPTELMRWLCRLITPPGGTVLDCFMGSGSTGKACRAEGFAFLGIEREEEYFRIAAKRIAAAAETPMLYELAAKAEQGKLFEEGSKS